jgi:ABC-type transport system involved in multi-copper enzyme maturation permease subunit
MPRSKSIIVAMSDFKMAMQLRLVKGGLVMAGAFGPVMVILLAVIPLAFMPPGPDTEFILLLFSPMSASLLAMFSIIPATMIAANALVGEREQNTLEPLLCTPLTDRELLWGKTLSSFIPSMILLICGVVASELIVNAALMIFGHTPRLYPDLPGLFLVLGTGPVILLVVTSVMIIISGKVTRVYEAYQASGAVVLIFMIPMFVPMLSVESGVYDPTLTWLTNLVIFLVSIIMAAITWVIALNRFNRDNMISQV